MHRCIPKVTELRERFPQKDIQVDGGVTTDNIHVCANAGTLYFVILFFALPDKQY